MTAGGNNTHYMKLVLASTDRGRNQQKLVSGVTTTMQISQTVSLGVGQTAYLQVYPETNNTTVNAGASQYVYMNIAKVS